MLLSSSGWAWSNGLIFLGLTRACVRAIFCGAYNKKWQKHLVVSQLVAIFAKILTPYAL